MTVAKWMREFIAKHPDYKQDSVITDQMNYSLLLKCDQIANGSCECPELLGPAFRKARHRSCYPTLFSMDHHRSYARLCTERDMTMGAGDPGNRLGWTRQAQQQHPKKNKGPAFFSNRVFLQKQFFSISFRLLEIM